MSFDNQTNDDLRSTHGTRPAAYATGRCALLPKAVGAPAPRRLGLARRTCALGLALALAVAPLAACSASASGDGSETGAQTASVTDDAAQSGDAVRLVSAEDLFSDRDLDGSYDESSATHVTLSDAGCTSDGSGATIDGGTVTITAAGTYVISGTLSDGQVVVDAEGEKVQIVLAGADVTCPDSAAVYVKAAKKVWLTLADDSANALATTGDFIQTDDNTVDGAVFSKADLTVNGTGALSVASAAGHGIVCKDALRLVSGAVDVTAARHAIQAKDYVAVSGGTWTLDAGTDGIHAENADDAEKGFIYVAGGSIDITAGSDGFDAANVLEVDGGDVTVSAGDDGLHAELDLVVNGGTVTVSQSYEGLEGSTVTVTGGKIDVTSSDDGINAAGDPTSDATGDAQPDGGAPGAGASPQPGGGQAGGGTNDYDSSAQVTISGGSVTVCAGGDGIDSNGDLTVTGGVTCVSGPTSDGDGSLDFPGAGTVSGGVVMCAGSSGMAQNFTDASGQASLLLGASGQAGDAIALLDSNGNEVCAFVAQTSYACVLVCAPGIETGQTYTLRYGENSLEVAPDAATYSSVTRQQGGPDAGGAPMNDAPTGGAPADGVPGPSSRPS